MQAHLIKIYVLPALLGLLALLLPILPLSGSSLSKDATSLVSFSLNQQPGPIPELERDPSIARALPALAGPACAPVHDIDFSWIPTQPVAGQAITLTATVAGAVWFSETVDSPSVGGWNDLALDSFGWPHIGYISDDGTTRSVRHAWKNRAGWHVEIADSGLADGTSFSSLVLDAQNRPHLSYVDKDPAQPDSALKYVFWDGSAWQVEVVGIIHGWPGYTSIAVDSTGQPHIAYYDLDRGRLLYASRTAGGTWSTETVDDLGDVGAWPSLALDAQDRPHISYYDPFWYFTRLKYAVYDGSAWQIEAVDSYGDVGAMSSLALDPFGNPHIAYVGNSEYILYYASLNGLGWLTETVTNHVAQPTLALDRAGRPHISYVYRTDTNNYYVEYTYDDGARWETERIQTEATSSPDTSLALDDAGLPHLSYCGPDYPIPELRYAELLTTTTPPVTYTWDLGDGTQARGPSINHTYSAAGVYTVAVTATNCATATATMLHTLTVVPPCVPVQEAGFTWQPSTPLTGESITLTAVATGTTPISVTWDLGDGNRAVGFIVTHTYTLSDVYSVVLTVTNCGSSTATATYTLSVVAPPCQLVELITMTQVVSGCVITMTAQATGTPPLAWQWEFGDGMSSTLPMPTHDYGASGHYTGTLHLWNCAGIGQVDRSFSASVECVMPPLGFHIYLPTISNSRLK